MLFAPSLAPVHLVRNLCVLKRDLGDQDNVGAAGKPAVQSNPSRVASHYLKHHDALVAGCCRVETVQSLGNTGDRRVETKSHGRGFKIIVDRLGDSDHGDAGFLQLQGGGKGSVAANCD